MKLDDKDIAIINQLRENSRISIRDIAKNTKIRPSTVHVRLSQLIDSGVIERFTLKLNNEIFGENFIVFVLIKTLEEIPSKAFSHPCVREVFGITGEYDMMMKLKFRDIAEFNDFLLKFRKDNKVGATVTMVSTITIKEEI
ncbi:Lrp/AsnC family transcriptional regulator [Candidatus Woesearchaeota archaeon]|nr:Lrp/AsnC family transcriptional regulator [Candidatus Woesearchaeota archaeon]